ncbi:MAG: class I SAM-dependent methyltransferase [Candidatus Aenigmarchaeota archaeon]|nr:class I SAM-dependent methyltransferase [Candidatus Aenigmarchaeota archaeon]
MKKIQYVRLPCGLCGGRDFDDLFTKIDRENSLRQPIEVHVVKCKGCGLIAANPRIKDIYSLYNKDYYKEEFAPYEAEQLRIESAVPAFHRIENIIGKKAGRLIDLGCGSGVFLNGVIKASDKWEMHGLDITNFLRGPAKSKVKFHRMTIDNVCKIKDKFDLAVMIEVAEHLTDPVKTFTAVNKALKEGGWLFISTANLESITAKIRGDREAYYKAAHVTYWSPKTIRKCLERCGFSVKVKPMHNGYWREFRMNKSFTTLKNAATLSVFNKLHFRDTFLIGGMNVFAQKVTK